MEIVTEHSRARSACFGRPIPRARVHQSRMVCNPRAGREAGPIADGALVTLPISGASNVVHRVAGGAGMRSRQFWMGRLAMCLLVISAPAFAHHAWHGYDMANVTTLKGTVTQFDWANPHVWI